MRLQDVIARLRVDLGDGNAALKRWSDPELLDYWNEGIRDLAKMRLFERFDLLVPTTGQMFFPLTAELVAIKGVWLDWSPLWPITPRELNDRTDRQWQVAQSTNLRGYGYIPGTNLRLWPKAPGGGTALSFDAAAAIAEEVGLGPGGDGYWCARNGNERHHFLPGDATIGNWEASGNLLVHYSYTPEPITGNHIDLESRYADAARWFAGATALESSDDVLDAKARDRFQARYERAKAEILKQQATNRSNDHVPTRRRAPGDPYRAQGRAVDVLGDI